jgi:hypothetical protein
MILIGLGGCYDVRKVGGIIYQRDCLLGRVPHCRELRIREGQLAYMPRASVGLGVASHPSTRDQVNVIILMWDKW